MKLVLALALLAVFLSLMSQPTEGYRRRRGGSSGNRRRRRRRQSAGVQYTQPEPVAPPVLVVEVDPYTPLSCTDVLMKETNPVDGQFSIDPDGPGGKAAVSVFCEFAGGKAITVIHHDREFDDREQRRVDNCEDPGTCAFPITYQGDWDQVKKLTLISSHCEQFLSYTSFASVLLWEEQDNKQYGWWLNTDGNKMTNWGGAPTGATGCACSQTANGCKDKRKCNANANTHGETVDEGFLDDKIQLPVKALHFGDTGLANDNEYGFYKLGPLRCHGGPTTIEKDVPVYMSNTNQQFLYNLPELTPGECRLEFEVKACRNAHISFSNVIEEQNNFYELGIDISNIIYFRKCKMCNWDVLTVMRNFLSCDSYKKLWVSWCDGCFRFGNAGENELLSYCPGRELDIKYVAYSTSSSVTGMFKFDTFSAKEITACEGNHFDINCGDRFINILGANYGRSSMEVCPSEYIQSTSCKNINSFSIVGVQCQGKNTCRGPVGSGLFNDPCPGTFKYLHVRYRCETEIRTKELLPAVCHNSLCNPRGGSCQADTNEKYSCNCRELYYGDFCEKEYRLCKAWGDPHYSSFNGHLFDFQGECKYILAQTCTSNSINQFKIIGINLASESRPVATTKGLIVQIGPHEITMGRSTQVLVNGVETTLTRNIESTDITIFIDGSYLVVESPSYGLKVMWNTVNRFSIYVDFTMYRDNICGLCGDFSPPSNTYKMRDGNPTSSINDFGHSWTSNSLNCETCTSCTDNTAGYCAGNTALNSQVEAACDPIRSTTGIFSKALAQFNPEAMYATCIFDLCSKPELDNDQRCNLLEEYASRILFHSKEAYIRDEEAILNWRAVLNCPYTCPLQSTYDICTSACQRSCFQRTPPENCPSSCVEGCKLAPGFVFEGDTPIQETKCGCRYEENYYRVDQTWMNADCSLFCVCGAGGFANCHQAGCVANAVCISKNQVHGCHCEENFNGDGLSLCQEPCPSFIGSSVRLRAKVDEGNHAIVDISRPISCEGYIRSVTVKRSATSLEPVTVVVWRRSAEDDALFTVVGSAQIPIDEDTRDLCICDTSKIPVRVGDYVGFIAAVGSVYYDETDPQKGAVMEADFFESPEPLREERFRIVEGDRAYSIRYDLESSNGKTVEAYMLSEYLGVQSGDIPDSDMSASSEMEGYLASKGRLDNSEMGACAWTAAATDNTQWLQVRLAKPMVIIGVVTQGHCGIRDEQDSPQGCVSSYNIVHSKDGQAFTYMVDSEDKPEIFKGKCNCETHIKNYFRNAIKPSFIRFLPITWKTAISMRVELIGKEEELDPTKVIVEGNLQDPPNTAVVLVGAPFKRNAFLKGLKYFPRTQNSFVMAVLRPTEDPSSFRLVGETYVTSTGVDQVQSFEIRDIAKQIPVQLGDVLCLVFREPVINFDEDTTGLEFAKVKIATMDLDQFQALELDSPVQFTEDARRLYQELAPLLRTVTTRSLPPVMSTEPMGIKDGQVRDPQLTSSGYCDSNSQPPRSRLNLRDQQGMTGGWCAQQTDRTGYIQVDFNTDRRCAGITTQGLTSTYRDWYTQKYTVQCSLDMASWRDITDMDGNVIEFSGNFDSRTEVENYFPTLWICRGVRVLPTLWVGDFPSLRFEMIGLPVKPNVKTEIGFPVVTRESVNPSGDTIVLPLKTFESDGFVIGIRFMAIATGSFDLTVFRLVDENTMTYDIVGIRRIKVKKANIEVNYGLRDDITSQDDFLSVKEGDVLGATFASSVLHMEQTGGDVTRTLKVETAKIPDNNKMGPTTSVTFETEESNSYSMLALFRPKGEGEEISSVDAKDPIGMENFQLPDDRITASSTLASDNPAEDFGPRSGRLKLDTGDAGAWVPAEDDTAPWIQVEAEEMVIFTGLVVQGRHSLLNWWVTTCGVQSSEDGENFESVKDCHNQEATFNANTDSDTEVKIFFCNPVKGKFLRVLPKEWNDHPAMRLEVLGAFSSNPTQYGAACVERPERSKNNRIVLSVGRPFESDGYIVEWKYFPISDKPFEGCVWRTDLGDNRLYMKVGCASISGHTPNVISTFQLNGPDQIPFRKGDVIGWSYTDNVIPYDTDAEAVDTMFSQNNGDPDLVAVGFSRSFTYLGKEAHSIGVSVRVVNTESVPPFTSQVPLGMESKLIRTANIHSSSVLSTCYGHDQARLRAVAVDNMKGCWAPSSNMDPQFIEVILDVQALISGLSIQGCNGENWRVTTFRVEVLNRHNKFVPMRNNKGSEVFTGNMDSDNDQIVTAYFDRPLKTTSIKIFPVQWFESIGLRFEVLGAKTECKEVLGAEPLVRNWKQPVSDAMMTIMMESTIPCNSYVTGWKFVPENTAGVTFYVLKKLTEGSFKVIGKTVVESSMNRPIGETVSVDLDEEEYILARAGYALGFSSTGQSPVYIQEDGSDMSWVLQARMTKVSPAEQLNVGTTMKISAYKNRTASFSFSAVLTQVGIGTTRDAVPAISCSTGMGMESGAVKDSSIRASSSADVLQNKAADARLNSDSSWTASQLDKTPWIEIAFGYTAMLTGIVTQGDATSESWVTSFSMEYTAVHNALTNVPTNLEWVKFSSDLKDIFPGNIDGTSLKINYFLEEIEAQLMRIHPEDFHSKASMRFDFIGCPIKDPCNPNPCQSGAPCLETQASLGYTCQCPSGRGGKDCSKQLSRCYASGDPHYMSFDGQRFDFQGKCHYVLTQTKDSSLLQHFRVSADNEPWVRNPDATLTKEVYVSIGEQEFQLKKSRALYVGNELLHPPYEKNGISIFLSPSSYLVLKTEFGLMVEWNGNNVVILYLPPEYQGEVEGLCGNFNGNSGDEFIPRGETASISDLTTFGESWKMGQECPGCPGCQESDPCRVPDENNPNVNKLLEAQTACKTIVDPRGPLSMCHAVNDPETLYDSCIYDFCATYPIQDNVCESIALYVMQCSEADVQVGLWRKPGFCGFDCPVGMTMTESGSGCPNTCGKPMAEEECDAFPTQGCICMPGMLLEDGQRCVSEFQCGCMHNGIYHKKGTTFKNQDCSETCTCNEDHEAECTAMQCHQQASCLVVEGIRGCNCKDGWSGDGIDACEEILNPQELITCQDQEFSIDCSPTQEKIEILLVEYGTTQRKECPDTHANPDTAALHPHASSIIKALCNDHASCTSPVSTQTFGTYQEVVAAKGLRIRYQCRQVVLVPPPTAEVELTACSDERLVLDCQFSKINVIAASFGRRQGDMICSRDEDTPQTEDCNTRSTFRRVVERCHGMSMCSLMPNPTDMGTDLCPDTRKFLTVTYQCHPNPDPKVLEEDNCDPDPCVNGVCETFPNGVFNCRCTSGFVGKLCNMEVNTCKVMGDPHYVTFDGKLFDFMGNCNYTLVKTQGSKMPSFEVVGKNKEAARNPSMSSAIAAELLIDNTVITMEQYGVTKCNGTIFSGMSNDKMAVEIDGFSVKLTTDFGLEIRWDGRYMIEVDLPDSFMGHTEGLCGTYNGNPDDDFLPRLGGMVVDNPLTFGNSWAMPNENCTSCEDCKIPEPCEKDAARKLEAQTVCANITSETGPFVQCHDVAPASQHFKDCVLDRCEMPEGLGYCEDYHAYADKCKEHGILIGWRRPDFCSINCRSKNMVYNPSGTACPATCANPEAPLNCNKAGVEACVCSTNMLKEQGLCINKDKCGCVDKENNGLYYKNGESYMTEGCSKVCKCVKQALVCEIFSCPQNEKCGKDNGTIACNCKEGYFRDIDLGLCVAIPVPQIFIRPLKQVDSSMLDCKDSFINIITSDFGPKAAKVCEGDAEAGDADDTAACNQPHSLAIAQNLCQGQTTCLLDSTTTSAFGMPCPDVVNYISLEFSCTHKPIQVTAGEGEMSIHLKTCEERLAYLTCPPGQAVDVETAFFGRKAADSYCLEPEQNAPEEDMSKEDMLTAAKAECDGKMFCTLDMNKMTDPWPESEEYLELTYICIDT